MKLLKSVGTGIMYGMGVATAFLGIESATAYCSKQSELEKINASINTAKKSQSDVKKELNKFESVDVIETKIAEKSLQFDATTLKRTAAESDTVNLELRISGASGTNTTLVGLNEQLAVHETECNDAQNENKRLADELGKYNETCSALEMQLEDFKTFYDEKIISIMEEDLAVKTDMLTGYDTRFEEKKAIVKELKEEVEEKIVRGSYNSRKLWNCSKNDFDSEVKDWVKFLNKQGLDEIDSATAIEYCIEFSADNGEHLFEVIKGGKNEEFAELLKELQPVYEDAVLKQKLFLANGILEYYESWGNDELKKEKDNKSAERVWSNAVYHAAHHNPNGSGHIGPSDAFKQWDLLQKLNDKDSDYFKNARDALENVMAKEVKYAIKSRSEWIEGFFHRLSIGLVPKDAEINRVLEVYQQFENRVGKEKAEYLKPMLNKRVAKLTKNRAETFGLDTIARYGLTPVHLLRNIPVVGKLAETPANGIEAVVGCVPGGSIFDRAFFTKNNQYARGEWVGTLTGMKLLDALFGKAESEGAVKETAPGIHGGYVGGDEY
jgi:hypothetical protein